jgi:hypothetical protein
VRPPEPPPEVEWAPAPAKRRSVVSGCFGVVAIGTAAALSTIPDAWPNTLRIARAVAIGGGGLAVVAGGEWLVRTWRAAGRKVRLAAVALVVVAGGAVAWTLGGAWARVTVCVLGAGVLAVVLAPRLRREVITLSDDEGPVGSWSTRVELGWTGIARAAGLVGPGEPPLVAPLLEPVTEPADGALELLVGLDEVRLLPEDVRSAEPALRRQLRADHVRIRPELVVDAARVRAYRRHPMDVPVSWTDITQMEDPTGEWLPVGPDEWGGQAAIRWRLPLIITGAQDAGKTALIRAGMVGANVQRLPVRWWIWDNRADYRQLSGIAHRYASTARAGLDMLRELDAELDDLIESSPDLSTGYERMPRLSTPADVLIVGELLTALGRDEVVHLLARRARDGRALAHGTWTTAQVSTKDDVPRVRDLFVQKACCRIESESLVDPALGSGALERGAAPHRIPAALRGVTVLVDPLTKEPYYARSALVAADEVGDAIVRPYQALMGRRLTVIDGDLDERSV